MDRNEIKNSQMKGSRYDQDFCGQELLKMVSRGSSIVAEILRLKDYIPEVFLNVVEEKKFGNIIFDFSYFKNIDAFEEKIANSMDLRNADEDFRENYKDILERFFLLFCSIYQYANDWNVFVDNIKRGIYIQHTIETILMSREIRHFLCESIFLYGVMLLFVDKYIPGTIREKILISYYRYNGQSTINNFNVITNMFRNTDYLNLKTEERKPKRYPVEYFARIKMNLDIIKMIVGILKDNDIYEQILAYPSPEHRSHALSGQGAMVFTILNFLPEYLEFENAKMRELVDKHFSDNWVIAVYMGMTVDIFDYWKDFKAAKNAINITINLDTTKILKRNYFHKFNELSESLKKFQYEGLLNEDYVLDNINLLLNIMRECNVVLRWILLQRTTTNKKFRDIINENLKNWEIINFLLHLSKFEASMKDMFQQLLENKEKMWNEDKENCIYRLKELIEYFAGMKNFGKQVKQEEFKEYFSVQLKNLEKLSFSNSTSAGRKIILIQDAIESIKMYHYIEGNLQIKQYLNEITGFLNHMLRIVNVKNKVLVNISNISDFSYAWVVIQEYQNLIQDFVKEDSRSVILIRTTFLKLASILNFPLVRLFEANSPDIGSVTDYYSGELVKYVRNILQIVPISVFNLHENVINLFSKSFCEMPIKILKTDLKDYAQLEDRAILAKSLSQISLFTKGILMMEKTLMGVITVDPKNILEDGIRQELLNLLSLNFNKIIDFTAGYNNIDLNVKLTELSKRINSIKKSFIYIQDYININGTRMWSEEVHRLINYCVDLEANNFLSKKIKIDSRYELSKFQIPKYPPLNKDFESLTFVGRLIRYIISVTKPKVATYYPSNFAWYDYYAKEVIGIKTFNLIKQAMGVEGFQGLNKLLSYMNYNNLVSIQKQYIKLMSDKNFVKNLKGILIVFKNPLVTEFAPQEPFKNFLYSSSTIIKQISQLWFPIISIIGHYEILRNLLGHCLKESLEVDSNVINTLIQNINNINLHFLKGKIDFEENKSNTTNKINNEDNKTKYFKALLEMFEDCGFVDTKQTFYLDLSKLEYLVAFLALTAFNEMNNAYIIDKRGYVNKKSKSDDFDLSYFLCGLRAILFQMGKNYTILFISILTNIIKNSLINSYLIKDNKTLYERNYEQPNNLIYMQAFLQEFCNSLDINQRQSDIACNQFLLDKTITSDL